MKTDQQLESEVREALFWEPSISADQITASAMNGVVTLSGRVSFYAEKRAAERELCVFVECSGRCAGAVCRGR
jgi:osmotically-inducible protein OsmY